MPDTWNAGQYLRFADERTRPCRDLVARVALGLDPETIADLGCGPGNSTAVLAERWPRARITGIDRSPEMLGRARSDYPSLRWEEGDVAAWTPGKKPDLVFSNAALQWLPDHKALLPRLLSHVAPEGALAVQVPADPGGPASVLMRELAGSTAWRRHFPGQVREWYVEIPEFYYDLLAPLAARMELWTAEYHHVMDSPAAITEWYKGTGLRPFLDALPDPEARDRFCADYTELLPAAYPKRADGKTLFPFRRLFLIAYR